MKPSTSEIKKAIETFLSDNMGVKVEDGISFAQIGVDSMGILKVLLFLEKECGIYIPDSELTSENIRSVESLAETARVYASREAEGTEGDA